MRNDLVKMLAGKKDPRVCIYPHLGPCLMLEMERSGWRGTEGGNKKKLYKLLHMGKMNPRHLVRIMLCDHCL